MRYKIQELIHDHDNQFKISIVSLFCFVIPSLWKTTNQWLEQISLCETIISLQKILAEFYNCYWEFLLNREEREFATKFHYYFWKLTVGVADQYLKLILHFLLQTKILLFVLIKTLVENTCVEMVTRNDLNPFHTTGLFLYSLKISKN